MNEWEKATTSLMEEHFTLCVSHPCMYILLCGGNFFRLIQSRCSLNWMLPHVVSTSENRRFTYSYNLIHSSVVATRKSYLTWEKKWKTNQKSVFRNLLLRCIGLWWLDNDIITRAWLFLQTIKRSHLITTWRQSFTLRLGVLWDIQWNFFFCHFRKIFEYVLLQTMKAKIYVWKVNMLEHCIWLWYGMVYSFHYINFHGS